MIFIDKLAPRHFEKLISQQEYLNDYEYDW